MKILLVDDDLAIEMLAERLRFHGHESRRLSSANIALENIDELAGADLVVLDIIMSWPSNVPGTELDGARSAGMELLRQIRERTKTTFVLVYSATDDRSLIDAVNDDPRSTFRSKWDGPTLADLVALIYHLLDIPRIEQKERPFIVHGHADSTKLELKNYLQNRLGLDEPIILHEQPSLGRTIIEKFEDNAALSTLVFVLLTPDDVGASAEQTDDQKRRARQNVIFELGYFLGALGRQSGRVILLHCGPIELPSDLAGIIYIDISGGIEAAGELIRRELKHAIA